MEDYRILLFDCKNVKPLLVISLKHMNSTVFWHQTKEVGVDTEVEILRL